MLQEEPTCLHWGTCPRKGHEVRGEYESRSLVVDGGIADCGRAQHRVKVCPKEIRLTTSIGELGSQATVKAFTDMFGR